MDFITALILGIVQGISEFLPISSTGHLILASHLMGLQHTEFLKSFEIAIQAGTILSVVALYWRSLMVDFEVIKRLAVAFLPRPLLDTVSDHIKIISKPVEGLNLTVPLNMVYNKDTYQTSCVRLFLNIIKSTLSKPTLNDQNFE